MDTENDKGIVSKVTHWAKTSIMLKMITIGFLILILLIPESMIQSLIRERSSKHREVVQEVSSKWGNAQTLTGPILSIPYLVRKWDNDHEQIYKYYAHFLPTNLQIDGKINPQIKHRGIYDVSLYDSEMKVVGSFDKIDFEKLNISEGDVIWDEAQIAIGITDMRGISEVIKMNWGNKEFKMEPGTESAPQIESGVHLNLKKSDFFPGDSTKTSFTPTKFSFPINVLGSSFIRFIPLGEQTQVKLESDWPDPKFDGAFLPKNPQVQDSGFVAEWKIISHNRNFPQQWKGNKYDFNNSAFGVDLFVPVDEYQKTTRSAKYASLIVLLTFLTFFFIEIANKIRIHPLQYILVGSALVLFYTLLLSISEHFGFNIAYIISTVLIALLIGFYSSVIFPKTRTSLFLTAGLGGIYSFLFFVLNSADYALLMGSIGLFIILAAVMYSTRNINFYRD